MTCERGQAERKEQPLQRYWGVLGTWGQKFQGYARWRVGEVQRRERHGR